MCVFPNGMGFVLILLIIFIGIIYKSENLRIYKKFILCSMLLYVVCGCVVLFRAPFHEKGEVYFFPKINMNLLEDKVRLESSAEVFIDAIAPENELLYETTIELDDGQLVRVKHKYYNSKNSRVSIVIYSLDDETKLKEEYLKAIEYEKNFISIEHQTDKVYTYTFDNGTNAAYIFPIGFDGTKFLLPFVDSNGANFRGCFYFGNSFVFFTELSKNISGLVMVDNLKDYLI